MNKYLRIYASSDFVIISSDLILEKQLNSNPALAQ